MRGNGSALVSPGSNMSVDKVAEMDWVCVIWAPGAP